MKIEIGIDTGGTTTDAVVYDTDNKHVLGWAKALTTKEDLSIGIGNALDGLPGDLAQQASMVSLSTTLATNACVEDRGGRAKLVLIGVNPRTVDECGGEYGLPPAGDIWFVPSSGTMQGEILEEPDWDAFMRDSAGWFSDASAVAVVELLAMWNNAVLEKKAREIISQGYSLPIICGHDLFSDLNSLQRAAGTLLNARLIPIIEDFLKATKRALLDRGITAPVVIVRSDGSLMSEKFTVVRPVETLLCGPAASVKGGMELGGRADCLIIDMGGTTTDIAIVKDGSPKRADEGINIGRWRTFVKGVFIETFGLGGDSAVRFDRHRALTLGPQRVIPLSAAASRWPQVKARLRELTEDVKRHSELLHEFYCPVKDIEGSEGYTDAERAFCAALKDGPLILTDAAAAVGYDAYSLDMRRLEREGIVIRAGLTPTDIMHIRGDFSRYDREAAELGAEFVSGCLDTTPDALCGTVYDMVKKSLYTNITRLLLEDKYPAFRRNGLGAGLEALVGHLWEESKSSGPASFLDIAAHTPAALIGVGAPIHVFLPDVAKALGTQCIIPAHAGVANALGAVVGNITADAVVKISPDYAVDGIQGYIVHGMDDTIYAKELDEAISAAKEQAQKSAVAQARLHGAEGDISVTLEVATNNGHVRGGELLLGVAVTARAKGSIAL